jgi:hypothetical protein
MTMRSFYVRPECSDGYGAGDGTSFEHAWNGFGCVDWSVLAAADPATLWVCGNPEHPGLPATDFVTVHVELAYLKQTNANALRAAARTDPRREPAESV